ncbi:hypothetical protein JNB_05385 [Janibacter sp. HTCC2649]|uniref:hypothetical protein n=1 Tax=Janibacter sp. HTCC2649 TaxID=313589 RepID=UPI000066EA57|nr:hypothetical protein [Janibacter sp. HTCC2649]EAP99579.1 hypothetical protein JNB_05385 [Janibacter sp. HTCC2649]
MTTHEQDATTARRRPGINRRTLMRTGAHAAWTVPTVQLVTQSPAMAASGAAAVNVTATNSGWTGADTAAARFAVTTIVSNVNTQSTVDLKVTYTLPAGVTAVATAPAGWTVESGNGSNVIVLDKIDPQLGAGASTGPFVVTFDPVDTAVGNSILVNLTASPGGAGTPGSTTTTVAASPPVLSIQSPPVSWIANGQASRTMDLSAEVIQNTGFQLTAGLKVVISWSAAPLPAALPNVDTAAPGWTASLTGPREVTFTADSQLGRNQTLGFDAKIRLQGNGNPGSYSLQMVVSATNATSVTTTVTG